MLEDLRTGKLVILGLMRMDISAAVGFDEVRIQTHTPGRRVVKVVNAVRPWPPSNNRHPNNRHPGIPIVSSSTTRRRRPTPTEIAV